MTQPPVRRQPGIPMWVWILVLIVVIAALWWILAAEEPDTGVTDEPFNEVPGVEAPPATGVGYDTGTEMDYGTDTGLGADPLEEPPPPAP